MPGIPARVAAAASIIVGAAMLAGCSMVTPEPARGDLTGMNYSTVDGEKLLMDACIAPRTSVGTPAVLLIHGGGFEEGGRTSSGMPELCKTLAASGFSAFTIDYRLLPGSSFPDQIVDAQAAVSWLREPNQAERFGIDPERIAAFGSSAGAIIAQGLGTAGTGALGQGSRVNAVVSMSGASDFTEAGLALGKPDEKVQQLILAYLGCSRVVECPAAEDASPRYAVTADDSPMILFNSTDEIVPVEQAEAMADALAEAGVIHELVVSDGSKHGISALSPANRQKIIRFLMANV
jgi:acetyl esterase